MLRLSVAGAVLALTAAPIVAPGASGQSDKHGDPYATSEAGEHGEKQGEKEQDRTTIRSKQAGEDQRQDQRDAKPEQVVKAADVHKAGIKVRPWSERPLALNHQQERRGSAQVHAFVPACPPGLAEKHDGCLPPGLAKARDGVFGYHYRPALFGVPHRGETDYAYYDGYLVPLGDGQASYIPLLGGALAVGQLWPSTYPSFNLPDWQRSYYGFGDPRDYRYADNVVYRIDRDTSAIQSVAALLTGSTFTVGAPMPGGYDVYNVPALYKPRYADNSDALYRYADGRVYQVDRATNVISRAIELTL